MIDKVSVRQMLANKEVPNLGEVTQLAVTDTKVLQALLDGIVAKDDAYRYNCFKVLLQVSENEPRVLYPEWDYFVELLSSQNGYHRATSVQIIASLTKVDTEKRFDAMLDQYFDILDEGR